MQTCSRVSKEANEFIECKDVNDLDMNIVLYKNKKNEYSLMGLKNNKFIFSAISHKNASINMYEEYADNKKTYIMYGNDKLTANVEYKVDGKVQYIILDKKDYIFEVIVIDGDKVMEDLKVTSATDEVLFTY